MSLGYRRGIRKGHFADYFLSHAHSDHYTNLSKAWNHGPIYCSKTTGNLIVHMLGVEPKWVVSSFGSDSFFRWRIDEPSMDSRRM